MSRYPIRGHILCFSEGDVYGAKHSEGQTTVFYTDQRADYKGRVKGWEVKSPLIIKDFLMAGNKLILAGHSSSEEERTGHIAIFSRKDGKLLSEFDISSPPVFQGIAVAQGSLFIATEKGTVICLQNQ